LDSYISAVVEHNEKLMQLNKAQLKRSKTAKGTPLINSMTGSESYSPGYAKYKGYTKPDLFDTGDFYKEMDIIYNEPNEYFLTSYVPYTGHLVKMYSEDLFGINDSKKAYAITTPLLAAEYRKAVL